MIYAHERVGYQKPAYWPENGAPPHLDDLAKMLPAARRVPASAPSLLAEPRHAPRLFTSPYVRDSDGALMVCVGDLGFVSETWAVKWGYILPQHTPDAKAARQVARAARKDIAASRKVGSAKWLRTTPDRSRRALDQQ